MSIMVGPVAVQAGSGSARVTVTRSLAGARRRMLHELVREAKRQLPLDLPSGVFVDLGSADIVGLDQPLQEIIRRPAYYSIVWIAVCSDTTPLLLGWQQDQPFDQRLLDGSHAE